MTYYTYFHTRNDTGAVFYVGKGKETRAYDIGRNAHWDRIVAKHGHKVHIAARWSTEKEAFEHEKFLILCFKDIGVKLTNMTDGGDGASGYIHTEAHKLSISGDNNPAKRLDVSAKISEKVKLTWGSSNKREVMSALMTGDKNPACRAEVKAKMSAAKIGKTRSLSSRKKQSASTLGVKKSPEHSAKLRSVIQSREKVECPHCGLVGGFHGMKRWHFDNCKSK